jgi:hypothetical protein
VHACLCCRACLLREITRRRASFNSAAGEPLEMMPRSKKSEARMPAAQRRGRAGRRSRGACARPRARARFRPRPPANRPACRPRPPHGAVCGHGRARAGTRPLARGAASAQRRVRRAQSPSPALYARPHSGGRRAAGARRARARRSRPPPPAPRGLALGRVRAAWRVITSHTDPGAPPSERRGPPCARRRSVRACVCGVLARARTRACMA